jgi:transcriptional regulator with XRE-family HTH domain
MIHNIDEKYIHHLLSVNIKRLRAIHNISQLDLAQRTGLAHNFINDIENCKKGISIKTLGKLSVALEVEPHQFLKPEGFPDKDTYMYMSDFSNSIQMAVQEVTDKYLTEDKD